MISEKKFFIHPKKFEIKRIIYPDNTLISSVEPIEMGGITTEKAADLDKLVEFPLLEACKILNDKGIETVFSSANKKDVEQGYAYISINFEKLSQRNKELALSMGELGKIHGSIEQRGVYVKIPINKDSTVSDVRLESIRIAKIFENQ